MYENCLEETYRFHQQYPYITFSYSNRDSIDENGSIIKKYEGGDNTPEIISPFLHAKIFVYIGSIAGNIANVAINRWALEKYGLFRDDMKYAADLDMWERLTVDDNIGRINKALIQLRNHQKQLSKKKGFAIYQLKEDLEVFDRMNKRLPSDLVAFATDCRKWRKELYYFAVLIGLLKNKQFAEAKEYYYYLTKKSSILSIAIRAVLKKTGLGKKQKIDMQNGLKQN